MTQPVDLISEITRYVESKNAMQVGCDTPVPGLFAFCSSEPTRFDSVVYEPLMCLVMQGAKKSQLDDRTIHYRAGQSLIVSHALPVNAAVTEASREAPYVSLALRLDLALIRSLCEEIGPVVAPISADSHSMSVADSDQGLLDAMGRLFRLSHDPAEVRTLAPLVLREIHFRLLRASHGAVLRQLLQSDSAASRITKAIALIRDGFRAPLPVTDLAAAAGMSPSSFHEHFKTLTSTTPLQYQKNLRLIEAKRQLSASQASVATVAYAVGYESPTQFSREFQRKFGISPSAQKQTAAEVLS